MMQRLKAIDGINLIIYVYDNTTEAIDEAIVNLKRYLDALKDYRIIVQAWYLFEEYGTYVEPFWKYPIECYSEEFYNEWYGKLANLLSKYSNVVGFIGYNEPYHHFTDPDDALTVCKREYTIWKKYSNLPFSTEINMPNQFWRKKWNEEPTGILNDYIVPLWQGYSDYIGINLWVDEHPPSSGEDPNYKQRYEQVKYICTYYSEKFNKPWLIAEFPCWHPELVKELWRSSVLILYKLWDWNPSDEIPDYSMFVINSTSLDISPTLAYERFCEIIDPVNQVYEVIYCFVSVMVILIIIGKIKGGM